MSPVPVVVAVELLQHACARVGFVLGAVHATHFEPTNARLKVVLFVERLFQLLLALVEKGRVEVFEVADQVEIDGVVLLFQVAPELLAEVRILLWQHAFRRHERQAHEFLTRYFGIDIEVGFIETTGGSWSERLRWKPRWRY